MLITNGLRTIERDDPGSDNEQQKINLKNKLRMGAQKRARRKFLELR